MIDCLQIISIIPFKLNHYGLKFRNIKSRINYFKCVSVVILICFYLRLLSTGALTKEADIFNFSMNRMTCIPYIQYTVYSIPWRWINLQIVCSLSNVYTFCFSLGGVNYHFVHFIWSYEYRYFLISPLR